LYAKEAELTPTDDAGNKELMDELGVPKGSLLPWLKDLRDENKITTRLDNNVPRFWFSTFKLHSLPKSVTTFLTPKG